MHCTTATIQNIQKIKDKILKPFREKNDVSFKEMAVRLKLIPQYQQNNQKKYKSIYQ